jgi:hypothetical protein
MKRIATSAVFVFALAGARGVLAQMGFRDWNAPTLDSPSERDSGSDYSRLIPDHTSGALLIADIRLSAQAGGVPNDAVWRALEGARVYRVLPPPMTTTSADLHCFDDPGASERWAFSPDVFALEPYHESVSFDAMAGLTVVQTQTIEFSGPLEAVVLEIAGQSDGPCPNLAPDCVLLKGSGAASGEWFQSQPPR